MKNLKSAPPWMLFLSLVLATSSVAIAQAPPVDCQTSLLGSGPLGEYFSVDIATGAGTSIGVMPAGLATELEYDLLTDTLWADEVNGLPNLHMIDPATGGSLGSVAHPAGGLTGMEFVGSTLYGTFIAGPGFPSDLVTVDTGTGTLTTIGATGFGPVSGLAYDTASGIMYGITAGGAPASLITIDLGTGAGTTVGATGLDFVGSIEFGPDGNLYGGLTSNATTNGQFLVQIDTATAAVTPIGSTGFDVTGLTACAAPIAGALPIPTLSPTGLSLLILLLTASAFLLIRRQLG